MKYELSYTKSGPWGVYLAYAKDFESDNVIEERSVYNKKLHCWISIRNIDDEIKDGSSRSEG